LGWGLPPNARVGKGGKKLLRFSQQKKEGEGRDTILYMGRREEKNNLSGKRGRPIKTENKQAVTGLRGTST